MSFLITPKVWIRLNDTEGLHHIGEILTLTKSGLRKPNDETGGYFMHDLACIYRGYSALALSSAYRDNLDAEEAKVDKAQKPSKTALFTSNNSVWQMDFPGKTEAEVRSLCGDNVRVTGDSFLIEVNMLTARDTVEHWKVYGGFCPDDHLNISSVTITPVDINIHISYPITGDF